MDRVIIIAPQGETNLSSISGSFEILSKANAYWKRKGNQPKMDICIAGFVKELKLDGGIFSVHPVDITKIEQADLILIPSINYDDHLVKDNTFLINWIRE